jgi:hypothetical protein
MKPGIDSRLVATVQKNAGHDCHLAANLLSCYMLAAHLWRRAREIGDDLATRSAWEHLAECEADLRRFVARCRRPALAYAYA